MVKLFVTGASGHIGQLLVPKLCLAGHHVICLFKDNSHPQLYDKYKSLGASIIISDLGNSEDFAFAFHDRIIIHLAAIVKVGDLSDAEKDEMYRVNFETSKKLFENFEKNGGRHFITIGTRQIFGNTTSPITEQDALSLVETIEKFPTYYAETKSLFYKFLKKNGSRYTILTPGIVYSSIPSKTGLPYIFSIFRGGLRFMAGDPEVSYTYINDLISAISFIISSPESHENQEYFISNGSLKRSELFDVFQDILGTKRKIRELPQSLVRFIANIRSTFRIPSTLLNCETLNLSAMNSMLDPKKSIEVMGLNYSELYSSLKSSLRELSQRNEKNNVTNSNTFLKKYEISYSK